MAPLAASLARSPCRQAACRAPRGSHRSQVAGFAFRKPCRRLQAGAVRCSEDKSATQHLFTSRIEKQGWKVPKSLQTLHPVAQEGWRSIHSIYASAFETPLTPAPWLGGEATVFIKSEDRQAGGTVKTRGAAHKCLSLSDEQLQRGIVAASTGNHGLALLHALSAVKRQRGIPSVPARIFLPRWAEVSAASKLDKLRQLGAEVELQGEDAAEAEVAARASAREHGSTFVSSYNDVHVAGGQGSLAVELLMQLPRGRLDAVFVPVGGGGLAAGVAAVLKSVDGSIHVVGCQPAGLDAMQQSVSAGSIVEPKGAAGAGSSAAGEQQAAGEESSSLAGGVAALEEGSVTLDPCRRFVDEWVAVSEAEIARAVVETVSHTGAPVDGTTGVAVAAFQKVAPLYKGKHVVVVGTGCNLSASQMDTIYRVAGVQPRKPAAV